MEVTRLKETHLQLMVMVVVVGGGGVLAEVATDDNVYPRVSLTADWCSSCVLAMPPSSLGFLKVCTGREGEK